MTDGQEVNGFSQYEMIVGGFSWNQAKADAESRGGHLATITSIEEQNAVEAVWDGSVNAWLGADDVNSQNDWNWITGEPAIFQTGIRPSLIQTHKLSFYGPRIPSMVSGTIMEMQAADISWSFRLIPTPIHPLQIPMGMGLTTIWNF